MSILLTCVLKTAGTKLPFDQCVRKANKKEREREEKKREKEREREKERRALR